MIGIKESSSRFKKRYDNQCADPPKIKKPELPEKNPSPIYLTPSSDTKASFFNFSNLSLLPKFFSSSSTLKKSKSQKNLLPSKEPTIKRAYPQAITSQNSLTLINNSIEDSYSIDSSPSLSIPKFNIVILGASVAGVTAAKAIEYYCKNLVNITLIEPQEKSLLKFAALSAITDYTNADSVILPYNNIFNNKNFPQNRILRAKANQVTETDVILHNGEAIPYNALIVATGLSYPSPISCHSYSNNSTLNMLKSYFLGISNSKCILIIGGGATGCEAAERIVSEFVDKTVILIHNKQSLLDSNYPDNYRKRVYDKLYKLGVNIILNDNANIGSSPNYGYPPKGRWVETSSQKMLFSDIQINCTGANGNTAFLNKLNSDPSKLPLLDPETSLVNVNINLQTHNYSNIFAIGDVNNIDGIKSIERARSQALTVSKTMKQFSYFHSKGRSIRKARAYAWIPDSKAAYYSLNKKISSTVSSANIRGSDTNTIYSSSSAKTKSLSPSNDQEFEAISTRKFGEIKLINKLFSNPLF
ncbi:Apoptosis-inducing factor-like protein [Smittium culicis]|uniref:Apoptosis-inducing factor-like protein n=1 Tax=Smittium culicis TaxID=133412 RepID=A0A1R1XFK9_9FUNG|nr:Apoptosis-inducing factor-like protein [Smittium culicis]